jgi:hypothetical protein
MYIGVIGEGICPPDLGRVAEEVGFMLAEKGCTVVCGGLGGVMEAACKGAKRAGGTTVGILPGNDRRDANEFVDVAIVTGLGEARNTLVVKSSQAVIAIGGRYGTLSEIGLSLKLGIPVVGLNTWQLYREGELETGIVPVSTAKDAVEIAISLATQ